MAEENEVGKNEVIQFIASADLEDLTAYAHALDDSDKWQYSLLLLAVVKFGDDISAISAFTKLPVGMVKGAVENLFANNIIVEGKAVFKWLDCDDDSGVAVLLDSMVAQGLLKRVYDDRQEPRYMMTNRGSLDAEQLIRTNPAAKELWNDLTKNKPKESPDE